MLALSAFPPSDGELRIAASTEPRAAAGAIAAKVS